MARIGFRVGTYCSKNNLTGIGRVAKNTIIEEMKIEPNHDYMLLEKNRLGVDIISDTAAISKESSHMLSLQVMTNKIDLVHSFYDTCMDFKSLSKVAKVLTVHDMIDALHPEWGSLEQSEHWKRTLGKSIEYTDIVIAVSEYTKQDIINTYGTNDCKIKVVYCGLDADINYSTNNYSTNIAVETSWNSRYILSVCTVEPRKNLVGLVNAYSEYKIKHKDDDVKLVIVGKIGWLTNEIFDSIKQSEFKDDIIITGYVTDEKLCELYSNALMVAYVSFYEGFGLPILEGMAAGKPVLTSNVTSMPEVGGDAVYYCNPYEQESVNASLEMLLQDEALRDKLSAAALIQSARFSYEKAAKETLKIYESIL